MGFRLTLEKTLYLKPNTLLARDILILVNTIFLASYI